MKKLLVIGGSYFAGRVFTIFAARAGYELTLVNRGRYSMLGHGAAREFHLDRRSADGWRALPAERYDAVVDFCAYVPGDVRTLCESFPGSFGRYILLSTADACVHDGTRAADEAAPLLSAQPAGPAGEYMFSKAQLERETAELAGEMGFSYTILRPSFIYGPYNYAPRESFFIEKIVRNKPVPVPVDADGRFTTVYVGDVADAVMACIGSAAAENSRFVLSSPEVLDYQKYMELLRSAAGRDFETAAVTVAQAESEGIPLPFPLRSSESEVFDGSLITRELGFEYTPLAEGMKKTFAAFAPVYSD